MSERAETHYPVGRRNWDAAWKYVAIASLSVCLGIIEGQFTPNRNLVTQDQLSKVEQSLSGKVDELNSQIYSMAQDIAVIKGELQQQNQDGSSPPRRR
jgi:TolA-binding protein